MKNAQKPDTIHLGRLIKEIKKGRYVVPDFQREFTWEPWDVRDLMKSVFYDYYIGSLLLWEADDNNIQALSCEPLYPHEGRSDPEYIVLDGQQRLTAFYYLFQKPTKPFKGRKNKVYFFIDLKKLAREDEDAIFYHSATKYYENLVQSKEKQYDELILPTFILGEGSYATQKWFDECMRRCEEKLNQPGLSDEERNELTLYLETARRLREDLDELMDNYQISFVTLSRRIEIGKVCEIFTNINQRGVRLDTFDLLNAIMRPKGIVLKNMYRDASVELDDLKYPGFELKTYILMVMSILEQNYCSPKYLYYLVPGTVKKMRDAAGRTISTVLIPDAETFSRKWKKAVYAIKKALAALKNPRDYGAISSRFLPYPSIIPVFAAIKQYVEENPPKPMSRVNGKIQNWYWASIFMNRYSSSVESTSARDFISMKKWFEDDEAVPDAVKDFRKEYRHLDLERAPTNSAIYRAIFNLIILNGARDFQTFELPEYEMLDDHHIVPRKWGKQAGIGNLINSILNKTLIKPETNRHILRDELPNVYLKRLFENNDEKSVYRLLESHLISPKAVEILLRDPFTPDDFYAFLEERKRTVLDLIESKFIQPEPVNEALEELDKAVEKIELGLRDLIIKQLNLQTSEDFFARIPSHLWPKVKSRVEQARRKNPFHVQMHQNDVAFLISFLDLRELEEIITNKNLWENFTSFFGSKEVLKTEFSNLSELRNALRHSRPLDDITKLRGKTALMWFESQLKLL